jgi:hypothetical protein
MKINDHSICVIISSKDYREHQINHTENDLIKFGDRISDTQKYSLKNKINFHKETGFRMLVFSEKSKNSLSDYSIPNDIKLEVLRSLPNRKDIIQVDKQNCIKYIKTDDRVSVINCYRKTDNFGYEPTLDDMIHTHFFTIDLVSGCIGFDYTETYSGNRITDIETMIQKFYSKFLVVVTYLELTEVKLKVVESILSKNRKSHSDISNTSRYNIIHVNSNWNTHIININSFGVRGHWRLQPCGVGRSQYKYVYIKPYEKGLIRHLPQKELVS